MLLLGHDEPCYPIGEEFLVDKGLWIHAKNLAALHWLSGTKYNYFWHQSDDFVLTSHNWIWTYPGKSLTERSVMVMPEMVDPSFMSLEFDCYAVCSDFAVRLRKVNGGRIG
jgi:hypothetical protein